MVKVCTFLADMGEAPDETVLERNNNNGNYEFNNCRWATRTESNRNTSRTVLSIGTAEQIRKDIKTWTGSEISFCVEFERKTGIHREAIRGVLRGNWK